MFLMLGSGSIVDFVVFFSQSYRPMVKMFSGALKPCIAW